MAISTKKCPLCMGRVRDGYCEECGYRIPDEEEFDRMSSLYDFEPENYPKPDFEPDAVPEEEHKNDMAYYAEPDSPRIPSIRVAPSSNPLRSYRPDPPHIPSVGAGQNIPPASPQNPTYYNNSNNSNNGANQPYVPGANGNNVPNQPYYNMNNNYGQGKGTGGKTNFSVSSGDIPWFEIFLSLVIPIVGIFFGIRQINRSGNDKVKRGIGIALIILGIIKIFAI